MLYMVYFRLEFSPMAFLSYLIEVSYMGRKKSVPHHHSKQVIGSILGLLVAPSIFFSFRITSLITFSVRS